MSQCLYSANERENHSTYVSSFLTLSWSRPQQLACLRRITLAAPVSAYPFRRGREGEGEGREGEGEGREGEAEGREGEGEGG